MSDAPTVSVVMSVYNGADGLQGTLDSIRQQTFADFELIIIDDGSRDQTWEILSQLELSRLRIHRNMTNRGQTACLNQAIEMAQGQYIARHDAQDTSGPSRFAQQVRFLKRRREVAMVGAQVDWVDRQGQLVRHFEYPTGHQDIVARLEDKNSFAHGSVMVRRDVLLNAGMYREVFRLGQDYDLWLRIAEKAKVANLPETLYTMRFSARMASVARNAEQAAYAELARKLAKERAGHGSEQTDLASAAGAIEQTFSKRNRLVRRMQRAKNYVAWAERLLWWGPPADRYAWALWSYAITTWPLNVGAWKFAVRELAKRYQHRTGEAPRSPTNNSRVQ